MSSQRQLNKSCSSFDVKSTSTRFYVQVVEQIRKNRPKTSCTPPDGDGDKRMEWVACAPGAVLPLHLALRVADVTPCG